MSKKNKRQIRREAASVKATSHNPGSAGRTSGFDPDYTPVIKDLRRIAILACTFILILVALSFFLR